MKAVLLRRDLASTGASAVVSDVSVPEISSGELLVEMKACGLCGTDIEKARGEYTSALPILGHEAVGLVAGVGGNVLSFRKGDKIFPHHHVPCHECFYCTHGDETACGNYRWSNIDPGGFSEFFRVPAWNLNKGGVLKLPTELSFEEATLIEPVGCCIRAQEKCKVSQDDFVLVVGAGPVGILHCILLGERGARVVVSDVSEPRLRFAEKLDVECAIDAGKRNVANEVKELTAGRGADTVIVASGSPKAVLQALGSARTGGKVCLFGVPVKGSVLDYDFFNLYNAEISVLPSYGTTDSETAKALALIKANGERFRQVITHRFHIEEFALAVETATSGAGMKIVINP